MAKQQTQAPAFELLGKDDLVKLIAGIGRQNLSLTKNIGRAAVQAIAYSVLHGDVTFGQKLVGALGEKSHNRAALVAFLQKWGNFVWSTSDRKIVYFALKINPLTKEKIEDGKVADIWTDDYVNAVMADNWETAVTPKEPSSKFDFNEGIESLLKRVESAAKAGKQIVHGDLYKQISDVVTKYHARLVLGEAADKAVEAVKEDADFLLKQRGVNPEQPQSQPEMQPA